MAYGAAGVVEGVECCPPPAPAPGYLAGIAAIVVIILLLIAMGIVF